LKGIQSIDVVTLRDHSPSSQIPSGVLDNYLTGVNI
jgi:hypothetical protein